MKTEESRAEMIRQHFKEYIEQVHRIKLEAIDRINDTRKLKKHASKVFRRGMKSALKWIVNEIDMLKW